MTNNKNINNTINGIRREQKCEGKPMVLVFHSFGKYAGNISPEKKSELSKLVRVALGDKSSMETDCAVIAVTNSDNKKNAEQGAKRVGIERVSYVKDSKELDKLGIKRGTYGLKFGFYNKIHTTILLVGKDDSIVKTIRVRNLAKQQKEISNEILSFLGSKGTECQYPSMNLDNTAKLTSLAAKETTQSAQLPNKLKDKKADSVIKFTDKIEKEQDSLRKLSA